ncbi:MAG TPA: hypothetical protein ENH40_00240 [Nitrospirae bacterium]|nr:hypothetical protein [Nitrospirota bacterium]
MPRLAKNRISVYLIKSEFHDAESIIDKTDELQEVEIGPGLKLYYGDSHIYRPRWVGNFFGDDVPDEANIFNASSKAILIAEVEIGRATRSFCIPFGQGRHLMQSGVWEECFGLKVTLNTIDPDYLRSIEKTNMSSVPKHANEQISRDGAAADFGIDIEQDLVRAVTGRSKEETFDLMITGKDSLHVSVPVNLNNIKEFLETCFHKSKSNEYKTNFGWIDQISEIRDPQLIETLNSELLGRIVRGDFNRTWMAVPQVIEWDDVSGFKYRDSKKDPEEGDIGLPAFLESLSEEEREKISIDLLKKKKVHCFSASADHILHRWSAYNCVYCEVDLQGNTYLLNNAKWYQIDADFAAEVNAEYERLRDAGSAVSLPECKQEKENDYNIRIAAEEDMCCMDRDNISYGGGYSKIEFCDLLTRDKQLIHVKKYGGSSVLSHLFSQGLVSAEIFLSAADFREKLNEKLEGDYKLVDAAVKPNPAEYEVVYAVISNSESDLELPFFSKVSLRNAKRRLEAFGYSVALQKIQAIEAEEELDESQN